MGFKYKYKPSKSAAREFAQKMNDIDEFCYAICIRWKGEQKMITNGEMLDKLMNFVGETMDFAELVRENRLDYIPTRQGLSLLVYWENDDTVWSIDGDGRIRDDAETRNITDCLN